MRTQEGQRWIVPLGGAAAELAQVGGKGAALMALAEDQFPVPPGFVIATAAYRRYVADNDLQPIIDGQLAALPAHEPAALARAADVIQAVFQRGTMSPEIASAIDAAYATLDDPEPAVAVRSSATAEDLPELSFAGQQETFLNVRGSDAVRAAVIGCWASLWTARAIGYRQQMAVPAAGVAMAVVVQEMVPAEVSGVLFTANPVTGQRGEMVIEAAPGLGEGLVGGTVTPESYAVARDSAVPIRVTSAPVDAGSTDGAGFRKSRLLPDAMLQELGQLGRRVKAHAGGSPRDIEWAIADGKLWLLQARPITNLPDAPLSEEVWESPIPGATWVRRQVVEHMPEPLSPLFAELYLREGLNRSINVIVSAMGMEDLMEQILSGPFFATVHGFGYSRGNIDLPRKAIPGMARAFFAGPFWMFHHGIAYWRNEGPPPYLATIARWHDVDPAAASDEELLRGMRELAIADAVYWFAAAIAIGAAKVSDWVLDGFLSVIAPNSGLHSGSFLRGFPSRTLEAEAELDAMARHARESAELREYILSTPADQLLAGLPGSPAGARLREELDRYFARHGHQIYNLDFVEPTLVEAPLPVFLGLKALVREPGQDALARQADVARARNRLTDETARSFDPLRRWLFRHLVRWAQQYAPYREDALFFV